MIVISGLPIPPSTNKQLIPIRRGRNTRFIKSKEARAFDSKIELFDVVHKNRLADIHNSLRAVLTKGDYIGLEVNCYFVFNHNQVITTSKQAQHKFKRMDANNRLKSMIDAVSKLIGIDDSYILTGLCEKVICLPTQQEQAIVTIKKIKLRTLTEIEQDFTLS